MVTVFSWRIAALNDSVVVLVQSEDESCVESTARYGLLRYLRARGLPSPGLEFLRYPRRTVVERDSLWIEDTCIIVHPDLWRVPLDGKS